MSLKVELDPEDESFLLVNGRRVGIGIGSGRMIADLCREDMGLKPLDERANGVQWHLANPVGTARHIPTSAKVTKLQTKSRKLSVDYFTLADLDEDEGENNAA